MTGVDEPAVLVVVPPSCFSTAEKVTAATIGAGRAGLQGGGGRWGLLQSEQQ